MLEEEFQMNREQKESVGHQVEARRMEGVAEYRLLGLSNWANP